MKLALTALKVAGSLAIIALYLGQEKPAAAQQTLTVTYDIGSAGAGLFSFYGGSGTVTLTSGVPMTIAAGNAVANGGSGSSFNYSSSVSVNTDFIVSSIGQGSSFGLSYNGSGDSYTTGNGFIGYTNHYQDYLNTGAAFDSINLVGYGTLSLQVDSSSGSEGPDTGGYETINNAVSGTLLFTASAAPEPSALTLLLPLGIPAAFGLVRRKNAPRT